MSDAARSLGELLLHSCERWPDRVAVMTHDKPTWKQMTYRQHLAEVKRLASALQALGLNKGERLVLMGENSVAWALTDWAAQTLGVVTVPIYPTLPADQAQYIAKDCGAAIALVGSASLLAKLKGLDGLRILGLEDIDGLENYQSNASKLDEAAWKAGMASISPEDMATIIYTSGTTGSPKGAMLPHRAFVSLCTNIRQTLPIDENDVFLSFLPLSHVYERFAGHVLPISVGACIAYARSITTLATDMETVKPTIMLCVPRFLESIRSRTLDSMAKQSGFKQAMFRMALNQGVKRSRGEFAPLAGLLDSIVGKKIREKMGGRMRFFVSGGAALPRHVADFYLAFRMNVAQGYGLTETCAASAFNDPNNNDPDTVGEPVHGVDFKFAPDGEILIGGPSVMLGYYNLPEATAEAIDKDGWFHTGDIGEWVGKKVKITDRKKDLIVLGNGKNVAPQVLENKLREGHYIAEAVLFGDGMEYICALIVPDYDHLRQDANLTIKDNAELIANEAAQKLVKGEIDAFNKTFADFEKVKRYELLAQPFSIDSGELTPSMKVKRKVVREKYADLLAGMKR